MRHDYGWDVAATLETYDHNERRHAVMVAPGYRLDWNGAVLTMTGPDAEPWSNGIIYSDLDTNTADAMIAAQVQYFKTLRRGFEWKLFDHDEPWDLAERLRRAGSRPEPAETLVVRDTREPFSAEPPGVPLELARLDNPADFALIAGLYGDTPAQREHGHWLAKRLADEKTAAPDALSAYAARDGDSAVAAGWIRFPAKSAFASLRGGATLPRWRSQGIYANLVALRHAEALTRGYQWLTVDCGSESLPILEQHGFRRLAQTTPWVWRPDARSRTRHPCGATLFTPGWSTTRAGARGPQPPTMGPARSAAP